MNKQGHYFVMYSNMLCNFSVVSFPCDRGCCFSILLSEWWRDSKYLSIFRTLYFFSLEEAIADAAFGSIVSTVRKNSASQTPQSEKKRSFLIYLFHESPSSSFPLFSRSFPCCLLLFCDIFILELYHIVFFSFFIAIWWKTELLFPSNHVRGPLKRT